MRLTKGLFVAIVFVAMNQLCGAAPVTAAENRDRVEYDHLMTRLHAGEQLTIGEKHRLERLGERVRETTPSRNPLDNQGGPDAFGYSYVDNVAPDTATYDWIELRGDAQATWVNNFSSNDDGIASSVPLGLSFPFYGTNYTAANISTNGTIQFNSSDASYINDCLPSMGFGTMVATIFPYWDDLHLDYGGMPGGVDVVGYRNFGDYTVIEFDSIGHCCQAGTSLKFEVILYSTGRMKFQYNHLVFGSFANTQTIGIQESSTGSYLEYDCEAAGPQPTEGLAIWWFQPDGVPAPIADLAATVNGNNVTLNWIDPTTDTNGNPLTLDSVQVWLGPIGSGQLLSDVLPGVQTYTHVGASDGFHTYYVRAYADPYYGAAATLTVMVGEFPWHPTDYDWEDITGNGTLLPLTLDDYSDPIDLGFSFPYNDVDYTQIVVASHGFVTLDVPQLGLPPYVETAIPNPTEPNNALYTFWDDNSSSSTGGIYYYQDAANGQFIVAWVGVGHFGSGEQYTFEIILNENGSIVMQYQTIPINTSCTVGIENESGTDGLQVCFDGAGDFLPSDGTAIVFYEQASGFAPVSGNVTLDGGSGSITAVQVSANGPGHPTVNPDTSGDYAIDSVALGNRRLTATLTGYMTDTLYVVVDSTGVTGADLTLRRVNPPAPTGFVVQSVDNNTGIVTMDWANSTDPLVDLYRVYRRLQGNPNWTLDDVRYTSDDTDTLTVDGIYFYCVTAVDTNVTPPAVESAYSAPDTALFGELPPTGLAANGNFDDRIRLTWLAPGQQPAMQLSLDDNSAEAWYSVHSLNGERDLMAVRFTPPLLAGTKYPLEVQACNLYLNDSRSIPNIWLCPDNGTGAPDISNAYENWQNLAAESSPGWLTADTYDRVLLADDGDFWVVWQMPAGERGPAIGASADQSGDSRSYWFTSDDPSGWNRWAGHDWMCRVWLGGDSRNAGIVVSSGASSGYDGHRIPQRVIVSPPERSASAQDSRGKTTGSAKATREEAVASTFPVALHDVFDQPYVQAPELVYQSRPGRSLDDIEYYKIYRNGTYLAQDVAPPYDDMVAENVNYSYYVTAHYDNNQDSPPSNTVQAMANMAPGTPTNFSGNPVGNSTMHLTWTDPTVNADGTPCTDLATVRVFRDGTLVGTVNAGVQAYSDTPPQPDQFYTWTIRARDEVPNEGAGVDFYGAVVSPWQEADYEWVDITANGTLLPLTLDDYSDPLNLGFDFEYFGVVHNQVTVASHGFVTLDAQAGFPPYTETNIPNAMEPNNAIYAFWDDNSSSDVGAIYYYQDAAEGRFIIAWVGVGHFGNPSETHTFEIILADDNSITMNYQSPGENSSCAIGVENADGSEGIQVLFDGDGWLPTDQSAIAFWGGPSGRIEGTVRACGNNQPIEGVQVETMELPAFTFTDATGFYSLRLDPGVYNLRFSRPGYCDTTYANVLVEDDNITIRNALMCSPQVQFNVTSISLATWPGHDVSTTFTISNPAGQCPLDFQISDTSAWLSASPETGSVLPDQTTTITVVASPAGLPPGSDHQSTLMVEHEALGSPYTIPVTLLISLAADDPGAVPSNYALYQNFPNPFNAITNMRFDVPQESRVRITLYNVTGQAVAIVADGMYAAGQHEVSYDATNLPTGMYLMKLQAGEFTAMKKMLLLK